LGSNDLAQRKNVLMIVSRLRISHLRSRITAVLRRPVVKALLVANLVVVVLLPVREDGWLQALELTAYDALLKNFATTSQSKDVFLVVTTEEDISRFGYPIADHLLATVLARVFAGGPKAVGVDLYRDIPTGSAGYEALQVLQRTHPELLWVFKLPDAGNNGVQAPVALRGTGREVLADNVTDAGGVVRRALLIAEDARAQRNWQTMGVALAQIYLNTSLRLGEHADELMLGRGRIPLLTEPYGPYAQVDASGYQMLFDFSGGHQRFRQISFSQIIDHPEIAEALRSKIVLVGTAALSVKDIYATPFSTRMGGQGPIIGIALHAHVADQLIRLAQGEARNREPVQREMEFGLVWAAAMAGALLAMRVARLGPAMAALVLGLIAIGGGTTYGFKLGLLLPGLPAGLAWVLSAVGCNFAMHSAGQRERAQLRKSFENYLDPRVIAEMLAADRLPSFGGEKREITAIFTDIAGFTAIAESMDPSQVAEMLGEYFDELGRVVMAEGGLVADYIGDAMVVLFGAPMEQPDHARRAVVAALAMDAAAERFLSKCQANGTPWGSTRIGVHTGPALVGNIGSHGRMKYSALGDTMNTASRVEGLNKYVGTRVCVTGDTAAQCQRMPMRPVAAFVVKGRANALPVLVPVRSDEPMELIDGYHAAYAALEAGQSQSGEMFAALHAQYPEDAPTAFLLERLAAGQGGIVVTMPDK